MPEQRRVRHRVLVVGLTVAAVGAVLVGAGLLEVRRDAAAPEPISSFDAPDPHPRGPSATPRMRPDDTAPGTVFIPALDVYAPVEAVGVSRGVLEIPGDPSVVGRDEGTAALASDEGTTFLAGHVEAGGADGALHDLARVPPGARVFTRDDDGALREWVVTSLRTARDKVMDADDFATTGDRRLVLVTCTGPVVSQGGRRSFRDSVVVTAVPPASPS